MTSRSQNGYEVLIAELSPLQQQQLGEFVATNGNASEQLIAGLGPRFTRGDWSTGTKRWVLNSGVREAFLSFLRKRKRSKARMSA